jgi:hypothetical protein
MSSRPGIIIVTSRPTTADFTADDLSKWYTEKHIPDVLATGGVQGALWCQLAASAGQVNGQAPPVPYLAMYYLPDLNWLHEESCQFWKLSMELDPKDMETAQRRNVFHVAEFSTASWELDEGLQITGLMPTSAVTHGGNEEGECRSSPVPAKRGILLALILTCKLVARGDKSTDTRVCGHYGARCVGGAGTDPVRIASKITAVQA